MALILKDPFGAFQVSTPSVFRNISVFLVPCIRYPIHLQELMGNCEAEILKVMDSDPDGRASREFLLFLCLAFYLFPSITSASVSLYFSSSFFLSLSEVVTLKQTLQ